MNYKQLQKYLACPNCQHQTLIFKKNKYVCPHCQNTYPIIKNVPILTPSSLGQQEKNQIKIFQKHYQKTQKPSLWQQSMVKRIFHHPFLKQTKTYLDIACGPSAYTIAYAQNKNIISIGFDISLNAILQAKKNIKASKNTAFLVASAQHLPFKKNTFDYISCISVLEHLKNQQKAVKQISQVLKPKGRLFLTLPNQYKKLPFFLRPIKKYFDKKVGHLRTYSINSTKKICQKHQLKLNQYHYNGHLLKFIQIILEKIKIMPKPLWWYIEKQDINQNPHGAQLNLIFQKIK